jgi:hypothetical protein
MSKHKIYPLLFLSVALTSCIQVSKNAKKSYRHALYIDYQHISFQGRNSAQTLYLEIDSTKEIWYNGKLIIDNKDTVLIRGFEKGNHYVTMYKPSNAESRGMIHIWCRGEVGQIRDSLTIEADGLIKEKTTLYRRPRRLCY